MSIHIDNNAKFGKVVLMPGDPLRAKWIAENFLVKPKLVTNVRGMLGYTGKTKSGKTISVMASGMGQPTMGIYSNELYKFYGVEAIIRVGTCGGISKTVDVGDIVLASTSSTDYDWMQDYKLSGSYSAGANYDLLEATVNEIKKTKTKLHVGNVISEAIFYHYNSRENIKHPWWEGWDKVGTLAAEMESYALYCNAAIFRKKALSIFTVSDHFQKKEELTQKQKETGLVNMIKIAIKVAEKFA